MSERNTSNHLTLCKKKSARVRLKCYLEIMRLQIIYSICMYKQDLALNSLQGLICHKTQRTNKTTIDFKNVLFHRKNIKVLKFRL